MSLQLIIFGIIFIGVGILGIKLKRKPLFGEVGNFTRTLGAIGALIAGTLLIILGIIFYIF